MSNYINLPLSGLEEPLSEMEQYVQDTAHRFAEEVLRPVGAPNWTRCPPMMPSPRLPSVGRAGEGRGPGPQRQGMLELEPLERERILLIARGTVLG